MVHSKRDFPSLLCHSSGLLPFSIALLVQEEPWILPKKQFSEITAEPPKAFLQKGGVWVSPVHSSRQHTDTLTPKRIRKPWALLPCATATVR